MDRNSRFSFNANEISGIQHRLLHWYSKMKRDLPWRNETMQTDEQKHAYAVWVSEIMLQQTRVATVIEYYNRWMSRWANVNELANADLEQVNEVWAGLGYYSRAKRLHEGAKFIVKDLNGQIPQTSKDLMKLIPGVGRYTAAAVSSIAFHEKVGVLDGNVIRVLSRLLTIGGDVSTKKVLDHLWRLVEMLVTQESPGDFNQAMMELGALICTPKSPQCSKCPLKTVCRAFEEAEQFNKENITGKKSGTKRKSDNKRDSSKDLKKAKTEGHSSSGDIEECTSHLMLPHDNPWIPELGVMNYPRKAEKKPPRHETAIACVIEMNIGEEIYYLLHQRPKSGLLAGLWEFPTVMLSDNSMTGGFTEMFAGNDTNSSDNRKKFIAKHADPLVQKYFLGTKISDRNYKGELTHIFSHIRLRYLIDHIKVIPNGIKVDTDINYSDNSPPWRWIRKTDFRSCAVSSAMHKILKLCDRKQVKVKKQKKTDDKQKTLYTFFNLKSKNENSVKSEVK